MIPISARARRIAALLCFSAAACATPAFAAGSNMPWEQPLQQILQSIEGPVAKIIAVIVFPGARVG